MIVLITAMVEVMITALRVSQQHPKKRAPFLLLLLSEAAAAMMMIRSYSNDLVFVLLCAGEEKS